LYKVRCFRQNKVASRNEESWSSRTAFEKADEEDLKKEHEVDTYGNPLADQAMEAKERNLVI
tara:strand:- start:270 stop:455 length:186 start_codon:yes stop_codon:yes gene_type:complete